MVKALDQGGQFSLRVLSVGGLSCLQRMGSCKIIASNSSTMAIPLDTCVTFDCHLDVFGMTV